MHGRAKNFSSPEDTRNPWRELDQHFERFESQPPPGVRLSRVQREALRAVNETLEGYQRAA